eukprot:5057994-Pleurochrysis_carterae.AAC.1
MSCTTPGDPTQTQHHLSLKHRMLTRLNLPDSKLARNPYLLPAVTSLGRRISLRVHRRLRAPGALYFCSQ